MYLIDFNSKRNILFANKILESTDLFVLVCDEKGKIIFINDYLRRVTNKSDNELLGFGWWKFRNYNENQLSDTIVKINSMIKLGQSESYINTLNIENQSFFIQWNDFVLDNKYLIGIGKDVTKEYTLNQQNERLSLVAKSVTNGVVITNAQGIIQWVNESFESLFDSNFDEVIGENITQLYCKGEVANDTFQGDFNSNSSFEFNFKSDKVASRWLLINTTPIFDVNKSLISYISVVTNISTRKKLETKLTEYADDLEINNLLKEQLIYSDSFEDIASASLITLKEKIPNIKMGSLLLLNSNKSSFIGYYYNKDVVKKVIFAFEDIKGYETLKNNSIFIEHDNRHHPENLLSKSDILRTNEDNIISYIELPIFYNNEFIGFVCLEFDCPFPMTERQINLVKNFATLLSVAIHKIQIQQDLTVKNKDITDSLFYAKSIQTSYLPHSDELKNIFKDFVLYYKPKDIVSGDFYWMEDFLDFSIIAVGDCTGHGVPGAFITMLGHNLLTQVTREMTHYSPSAMITFIIF
jgi:PAS domain S-box-containing protein